MRTAKTATDIRQEQIAEAAMELIGMGGLSNLSIASIAQRVGIVPSAVYRHYESKEAVLDAVLDVLRSRLLSNVEAACTKTLDALSRLKILLELHILMLVENPAFPHVIFAHFSQADHMDRWSNLKNTMCCYLKEISHIIEQGQYDGVIQADIPSQTAAIMFIGLILPAAMLHRLSNGEFDPSAHIKKAWPIFVCGLTTEHINNAKKAAETPKYLSKTLKNKKSEEEQCSKK